MMRKTLGLGICAFLAWAANGLAATNSTLYTDNFEIYANNEPLISNVSNKSWYASSAEAVVQTNISAEGSTKAARVPLDVTLSNRFAAVTSTNVWLRIQPRIVRYNRDVAPSYDTNATVIFYVDSNGYFVVRNGTNTWVTLTVTPSGDPIEPVVETNFNTIDVFLNYSNKTWRLKCNAVTLTNNLGFVNTAATNLAGFDVYNGGVSTSYLDNVRLYDSDVLPRLSANPTVLTNAPFFGANAANQSFQVISTGDGVLNYYIVTNNVTADWSMAITNNATGILTNNATNIVWVTYSTASLLPGSYTNSFSVVATNYEAQTQIVEVVINVRGMSVVPTRLSSSRMLGFAAVSQSFDIIQTGTGTVDYTISTNPQVAWLTLSSGSGSIIDNQTNTIYVSYFTNGLAVGTATARLDVITLSGGGVTQYVNIAITNYSRPLPTVNFLNYNQTLQKGQQPADTNLLLNNAGGTPRPRMNYAATSDVPWLLVSTNGTALSNETKTIVVHFNNMTTNSGQLTGHLTVSGTDAGPGYTPTGQVTVSTQVTMNVLIIAPGKPGNLLTTKGSYTNAVYLTWNTTTNVNHFELWRGTNSNVNLATRFESSAATTSYVDSGINPGIVNYYWVKAINAYGGDGDYSSPDTGYIYLNAPVGLSASDGVYTDKVTLSWTASSGAQNYEIWRSAINLTNTAVLVGSVSSAATTFNDTSAVVETPYYYWIKSRTYYFGNFSSPETGYRAALLQPQSVVASDGEFTNKVRVIWQAVDNASSYEVWRNTITDRTSAVRIGDSAATGYDDQTTTQGAYYYYWIRAANYEGYSRYSDSDYGWRQLVPPDGIAASDGAYPYRIRVSWNSTVNATSYEIWRGTGTGIGSGTQSAAQQIDDTANTYYDDRAVVDGSPYYYRVKAKGPLGGASDYSSSDYGWRDINAATTTRPVKNDYDGDHLSDLTLYNSTSGVWQILASTDGEYTMAYGNANSLGVMGDYDGDGTADPMDYWANDGIWIVRLSAMNYTPAIAGYFGGGGAGAAPADYDGDGITDLVVYNEAAGILSVLFSNHMAFNASVSVALGGAGWAMASADYDGDAKADPAVYSAASGQLVAKLSASGYPTVVVPIGGAGITMHPADYDGDAKADLVTYEESSGSWVAMISSAGYVAIPLTMGGPGYRPFVADYDGDSRTDPAVYSEGSGAWQIKFSASGYPTIEETFGGTNRVPVGR